MNDQDEMVQHVANVLARVDPEEVRAAISAFTRAAAGARAIPDNRANTTSDEGTPESEAFEPQVNLLPGQPVVNEVRDTSNAEVDLEPRKTFASGVSGSRTESTRLANVNRSQSRERQPVSTYHTQSHPRASAKPRRPSDAGAARTIDREMIADTPSITSGYTPSAASDSNEPAKARATRQYPSHTSRTLQ